MTSHHGSSVDLAASFACPVTPMIVMCLALVGVLAAVALFIAYNSLIVVPPGQTMVVWRRFGTVAGTVRALESGTHLVNFVTWAPFGQGPFRALSPDIPPLACPVPGSSVFVDPDRIEVMSSDGVPGTANVALELRVTEWTAKDLIGHTVSFRYKTCVAVNQWVSRHLGKLSAKMLCWYAEVISLLNNKDLIDELNAELKPCYLEAKRISLDPSGIIMHPQFAETVGKEINQRRALELQSLEFEAAERAIKLEMLQAQAKCEQARLQAETERVIEKAKVESLANRASSLIAAGISPSNVANILVAEIAAAGISRADKVIVGVPQGLVGLKGVENVMAPSSLEGFDKL